MNFKRILRLPCTIRQLSDAFLRPTLSAQTHLKYEFICYMVSIICINVKFFVILLMTKCSSRTFHSGAAAGDTNLRFKPCSISFYYFVITVSVRFLLFPNISFFSDIQMKDPMEVCHDISVAQYAAPMFMVN